MLLVIDDEKDRMMHVCEVLEKGGYNVKMINEVDHVLEFIEKNKGKIKAVVLDIMMPWGNTYTAEETNYGTKTGHRAYYDIRKIISDKVPIIIYSAYKGVDILNDLRSEDNTYIKSKADTSAKDILSIIKSQKK